MRITEEYLRSHAMDEFHRLFKNFKSLNEDTKTELLKETDAGDYLVREENWSGFTADGSGEPMKMISAYSKQDGSYMGEPKNAEHLNKKFGITHFEKAQPEHKVASIGFNPDEEKWYGWSHRAIHGYGIGDELEDDSGKPIGGKIESVDQAKTEAKKFARSVS